ncbi:type IV secretion system protein [Arhodomonas sp. AD133]|uniref:type IV secretion system protein n=1 Tax=Arhodomonas sp. AD133 TaxID=3415009 RepID=UPI003EBDAA16
MAIVKDIIDSVNDSTELYISDVFANIGSEIAVWVADLFALYFILMGLGIWLGWINRDIREVFKKITLVAVVWIVCTSFSVYQALVVDIMTDGPPQLAATITGSNAGSIHETLDETMADVFKATFKAFRGDGWGAQYLLGLAIFIPGLLAVAVALVMIVTAKIAIAVLVAVGPLFIIALVFSSTKRLFEMWLQHLMNFFLVIVLTAAFLALTESLFKSALSKIPESDEIAFSDLAPFVLTAVVIFMLLRKVETLAAGLSGGMSLGGTGLVDYAQGKMGQANRSLNKHGRDYLNRGLNKIRNKRKGGDLKKK